ncbi:hypothetical protein ACH4PR_43210 [Streptomyces mirabilis]|uniref:hypothetical protein n=1 Tax=Streptomyces mirabilis TaxID=68239 RepID=UPI0037BCA050
MLLRLAYLTVATAFAVLRLLPMSDRDKHTEILALRHQITVLERQLGGERIRAVTAGRRVEGMAAAGLLDGRPATTHIGEIDLEPGVELDPETARDDLADRRAVRST